MGLYSPDENLEDKSPRVELERLSRESGLEITSQEFSEFLDSRDHLASLRSEFRIPLMKDNKCEGNGEQTCIYLCGNSLGLQPKNAIAAISQLMDELACGERRAEDDHLDKTMLATMSELVGSSPHEITMLMGLTVNLHMLMISFYRPTPQRHKILIESKAFPSDHYLAESQIRYNGYDPETSLIAMKPRAGEELLRTEDIVDFINNEGDSIALVLFPGVHYYTGQLLDMETIAKAAQIKGCVVGFDLAHAVGNVEIHLHRWGVDFAAWCTYKYLNSGPGCIGAAFIHEKHAQNGYAKFLGPENRKWEPSDSLLKDYVISPPCPLLLSNVRCSLEIFAKTTVRELRNKSFYLTGLLEYLLQHYFPKADGGAPSVSSMTSEKFHERGAQLSLVFSVPLMQIHEEMTKRGVMCDVRKPDVIRIAPAPMYCRFRDVYDFVRILRESFEHCKE